MEKAKKLKLWLFNNLIWLFLAIMFILMIQTPGFFTVTTFSNILQSASIHAIISLGVLFVVITGNWDLSIGSIAGLTGTATCFVISISGGNLILGLIVGFAIALLCGLINGTFISYLNFQDIVFTIATGALFFGSSFLFAGGRIIHKNLGSTFSFLFNGKIGSIPFIFFQVGIIYFIAYIILNKSIFGRKFYSTGYNRKTSHFSGINIKKISLIAFIICGLLAGYGGVLGASEHMRSWVELGQTYLLTQYCIIFLGGAIFGKPCVLGNLVGAICLSAMKTWIILSGFSFYLDSLFTGIFLIVAVITAKRRE